MSSLLQKSRYVMPNGVLAKFSNIGSKICSSFRSIRDLIARPKSTRPRVFGFRSLNKQANRCSFTLFSSIFTFRGLDDRSLLAEMEGLEHLEIRWGEGEKTGDGESCRSLRLRA